MGNRDSKLLLVRFLNDISVLSLENLRRKYPTFRSDLGLCINIDLLLRIKCTMHPFEVDSYRIVVTGLFASWPKWSGDARYPVPASHSFIAYIKHKNYYYGRRLDFSASMQFYHATKMYSYTYGKSRRNLAGYLSNKLSLLWGITK